MAAAAGRARRRLLHEGQVTTPVASGAALNTFWQRGHFIRVLG
jgi:hypothetical protein